MIKHLALGPLLIFDPTNRTTPIGDLPGYEQGGLGLVVAGNEGSLVRMPVTPPDLNTTEVSIEASLSDSGELKAAMIENDRGQAAVGLRASFNANNPEENKKLIEHWLSVSGKTVQVDGVETRDAFAQDAFNVHVEFASKDYAQLMQGRLLVFKPFVVGPRRPIILAASTRNAPMVLYAEALRNRVRIKLPSNFAVDELPDGAKSETPFAQFACEYKVNGDELLVTQELKTEGVTLPPQDYDKARTFFAKVQGMQEKPIVLVKN